MQMRTAEHDAILEMQLLTNQVRHHHARCRGKV
jgi:hypothetical protein